MHKPYVYSISTFKIKENIQKHNISVYYLSIIHFTYVIKLDRNFFLKFFLALLKKNPLSICLVLLLKIINTLYYQSPVLVRVVC